MEENPLKRPFDLEALRRPAPPPPQGQTADELADALGPFAPPDDFDFGDEFDPETPRPIPRKNRRGSYSSRRRSQPLILMVLGIAFVVFRMLPSIENLGNYILPLWYLDWVGGLVFLGGVANLIRNLFAVDEFKYIRNGIPTVGRVIHLHRAEIPQIVNGALVGTECSFRALIEFINPQREQREFLFFQTATFPKSKAERYESGLAIGDYITLVSLPGDFATNLRVYAWTGLSPDQDWPKLDGKSLRGMTPLKALLIAKTVLLGLWLLVGFLHLFLYFPEDWSWKWGSVFMGLGVVCGVACFLFAGWRQSKAPPLPGVTPASPRAMVLWGIFLGLLLGIFSMCLVNSLFDRSMPVPRSVEIVNFWETTHNGIIRTYDVELRPLGGVQESKKGISYSNLQQLQSGSKYGVELVKRGWLGLEWTDGVRPVEWQVASDPPNDAERSRIVRFKSLKDGEVIAVIPYIQINRKLTVPPPPDLLPLAIQDIAQQNQMQVVE